MSRMNYRVVITKSEKEWAAADEIVRGSRPVGVKAALSNDIRKLATIHRNNPSHFDAFTNPSVPVQFPLREEDYKELRALAIKLQRPLASIIDALVFLPLLMPKEKM